MTGYLDERRRSPASLMLVVAGHAAVLTALLLAKQQYDVVKTPVFKVKQIPDAPVPPEAAPPPPERAAEPRPVPIPMPTERLVALPQLPDVPLGPVVPAGPVGGGIETLPVERQQVVVEPPAPPLRVAARIDGSSRLQPPYPAGEQRAGREGQVTVRVTIGADGRVIAVERVSATSDAFWIATERQALRAWRFRPATLDGRPVESRQVLTVRFRIDTAAA